MDIATVLFGASEQGGWYDPSDLSTLWQDESATTPVTADGQSVQRIDDKSGNGNHLTVVAAGEAPVYKTDGILHWLEFTGGSHRMWSTATMDMSGGDKVTHAASVRMTRDATLQQIVDLGSANSAGEFGINISATNELTTIMRGSAATLEGWVLSSEIIPSTRVLLQLGDIANDINQLRVDGVKVAEDTGNLGTGNLANTTYWLTSGRTFGGRIYQVVVRGALTSGDTLDELEAFLAEKAGHNLAYTAGSMYAEMFNGALNVHTPLADGKYITWRCEDYDTTSDPAGGGPGSVLEDLYYTERSGNAFGRIYRLTDVGLNEFAIEIDDATGVFSGHDVHAGMARRASPSFKVDDVTQTIGTRADFEPSSKVELIEFFEIYDRTDGVTVIAHLDTTKTWRNGRLELKQEITYKAARDVLADYLFMLSFYREFDNDVANDYVIETITMPNQGGAEYTPGSGVDATYPEEEHFQTVTLDASGLTFDIKVQNVTDSRFRSWVQASTGSRKFYMAGIGVHNTFGLLPERTAESVVVDESYTLETWVTPGPAAAGGLSFVRDLPRDLVRDLVADTIR